MSRIRLFNTETFELHSYSPQDLKNRKYAAISYVWEYNQHQAFPANVIIKGTSWEIASMAKPELLEIIYFCRKNNFPEIWMDVLCIEQDNNADKGAMVPLMSYIYGDAKCTFVKLDENFPDSGILAWNDADPVTPDDLGLKIDELGHNTLDHARGSLKLCRWFTRVWTLQEAVLSKELVIMAKKAGTLVKRTSLSVFHKCVQDIGEADVGGQRATDAYLQCSVLNTSQPLPLCLALQAVSARSCSLPEDRYYGVFGLLKNVIVSPRYPVDVDTARDIFLRNLSPSEALQLACVDHRGGTTAGLPSWAPRAGFQMRGAPVSRTPPGTVLRDISGVGKCIVLKPGADCEVVSVKELLDDGPAIGVALIKGAAKAAVDNGVTDISMSNPLSWYRAIYLPTVLSMVYRSFSRNHNYELTLRDGNKFSVVAYTKPKVGWFAAYGGSFALPWPAGDSHAVIMFTVDQTTSIGRKEACYSTTTNPDLTFGTEEVAIA